MKQLPIPSVGVSSSCRFVSTHFSHLVCDEVTPSPVFRGGQQAADDALLAFDVSGYAADRSQCYPQTKRAASGLSPWIRHGFLQLGQVWSHVEGGPDDDVKSFRNELLWQEYTRHWYARLGERTKHPVRHVTAEAGVGDFVWNTDMACVEAAVDELEEDGWLVNQSRMWLASHWNVRHGHSLTDGEDYFFRHLLDGSRAANRQGWQWVSGASSSKRYGFSRWQVEKWAAGLCATCELATACPIEQWPEDRPLEKVESEDPVLRSDPDLERTAGPSTPLVLADVDAVWITAESLGAADPALLAHPDLPVVFVFDEPLLQKLQLSSKRLIFLVESLAELERTRDVTLWLGDPVEVLQQFSVATTFAPVPGWHQRASQLNVGRLDPWPWLVAPHDGSISSFSAWRAHSEKRPMSNSLDVQNS